MSQRFLIDDFDSDVIRNLKVGIVGYGNQGHAHALNLRDSGLDVRVGARDGGTGYQRAQTDGFLTLTIEEAVCTCDVLMVTLPDEVMPEVFRVQIQPLLRAGQCVLFAHGFGVVFGGVLEGVQEDLGVDIGLVGPKGAGVKLRAEYLAGRGLAGLVAVQHDATGQAWDKVLGYAEGLGCFRSVVLKTTFREETVTDLFGEQAVLCGGIPELLKAAFDTLVAAGYSPESAYFECIHEAKLITDLIYDRGISGMRQAISNTAEYGGFVTGPEVVGDRAKEAMAAALKRIESGEFGQRWMSEAGRGMPAMKANEIQEAKHESEPVGRRLRVEMGIQSD